LAETTLAKGLDYLATHPNEVSSSSPFAASLEERREKILAALRNGWSWKKVAEGLKADGLSISAETLRRHMGPQVPKRKRGRKASAGITTHGKKPSSTSASPGKNSDESGVAPQQITRGVTQQAAHAGRDRAQRQP